MKDLRNCRCCKATYEKPTDYWCVSPLTKDGEIVEPIGFCEFCDKNNQEWYIKDKQCHSQLSEDN